MSLLSLLTTVREPVLFYARQRSPRAVQIQIHSVRRGNIIDRFDTDLFQREMTDMRPVRPTLTAPSEINERSMFYPVFVLGVRGRFFHSSKEHARCNKFLPGHLPPAVIHDAAGPETKAIRMESAIREIHRPRKLRRARGNNLGNQPHIARPQGTSRA